MWVWVFVCVLAFALVCEQCSHTHTCTPFNASSLCSHCLTPSPHHKQGNKPTRELSLVVPNPGEAGLDHTHFWLTADPTAEKQRRTHRHILTCARMHSSTRTHPHHTRSPPRPATATATTAQHKGLPPEPAAHHSRRHHVRHLLQEARRGRESGGHARAAE